MYQHRTLRAPLFGIVLLLGGLCLSLAGCSEPAAPPLNTPGGGNAPVASGTGDTPGTTPGTAAANGPNGPAGANAPSGKPVDVEMVTSEGTVDLELYPDKAPITVKNFESYAKKGFYDGTVFHRVIKTFMIQGGGFTPDLKEKETDPPIKNEAGNGLKNERGTVAMARTGDPDSATAQFFINVEDNSPLDHSDDTPQGMGYAVFGKVTNGMEVVDKIRAVKTTTKMAETPHGSTSMDNVPVRAVTIKSVKIKEPAAAGPA